MSGFTSDKSDSINRLYDYVKFTASSSGVDEKSSVKYYGAGLNSSEDDTPKIMRCVNANINQPSGGIVYIPDGKYKINTPLIVPACANLKFYGTSATFVLETGAYIEFNGCSGLELSGIDIVPLTSSSVIVSALRIINCVNFFIHDLDIIGNSNGILSLNAPVQFANGILIMSTFGFHQTNILTNCHVMSCTNGIVCASEYVLMNDLNVLHCSNGIVIPSGNTGVKNSNVTANRIGIMVYGPNSTYMVPEVASSYSNNPDHSAIIGCTINHNTCCGILLNSATSGYLISSNLIIANGLGTTSVSSSNPIFLPATLDTYAYDPVGKLYGYGIYIQRCTNLNIVSNFMQQNYINIGASAYKNSIITSNTIHNTGTDGNLGVLTRGCIVDFNNDNVATSAPSIPTFTNQYNSITNNNVVGRPSPAIFGSSNPILFNGTLVGEGGYIFKGNSGSGYKQSLRLTTSDTATTGFEASPSVCVVKSTAVAAFTLTGAYETYYIDSAATATLSFGKSLDNTSFNIIIKGSTTINIVATGLSLADNNVVTGSGLVVSQTGTAPNITRTFAFSQAGLYRFQNFVAESATWVIQCPNPTV